MAHLEGHCVDLDEDLGGLQLRDRRFGEREVVEAVGLSTQACEYPKTDIPEAYLPWGGGTRG